MNNFLDETIDKFFKNKESLDNQIFAQLALYIYYLEDQRADTDLYIIAKLLKESDLKRVISYFSSFKKGGVLRLPSNEQYQRSYLLAICYYLKEILKWDWNKIKKFLPLPDQYQDLLSSISLGKRINNISENLNRQLLDILSKTKIEDLIQKLEETTDE